MADEDQDANMRFCRLIRMLAQEYENVAKDREQAHRENLRLRLLVPEGVDEKLGCALGPTPVVHEANADIIDIDVFDDVAEGTSQPSTARSIPPSAMKQELISSPEMTPRSKHTCDIESGVPRMPMPPVSEIAERRNTALSRITAMTSPPENDSELDADHDKLRAQFSRLDKESIGYLTAEICFELATAMLEDDCPSQDQIRDALVVLHHSAPLQGESGFSEVAQIIGLDYHRFVDLMTRKHGHAHKHHHHGPRASHHHGRRVSRKSTKSKHDLPDASVKQKLTNTVESLKYAFELEEQEFVYQRTEHLIKLREQELAPHRADGTVGLLLDVVPSVIIILNALVMGISTEYAQDSAFWEVLEVLFLLCYVSEGLIKILLFGAREYVCGLEKYWNWFDIVCILLSTLDLFTAHILQFLTSSVSPDMNSLMILRMLRLVRLARLVRALHYPIFTELKAMVYGVFSGMRTLFWAIVLLFILTYFFGIILNRLFQEEPELEHIDGSMFTFFRCLTDGCADFDGRPLSERLRSKHGGVFMISYVFVITSVTFGLFNLIMAVFLESVVSEGVQRKQYEIGQTAFDIKQQLEETFAKLILLENPDVQRIRVRPSALQEVMTKFSPGFAEQMSRPTKHARTFDLLPEEVKVSRSVFNLWMQDPQVVSLLKEADIDTSSRFKLFDIFDADMGGELDLPEIIDGLMHLRGPVTKADIVAIQLKTRYMTEKLFDVWVKAGCDEDQRNSRGSAGMLASGAASAMLAKLIS